jgi:hypothetical protein
MPAADVTAALERYEAALRSLGAPVARKLRPGIGDAELRELERRYGVELPEDAVAVWRWHNGVHWSPEMTTQSRFLVPYRYFGDLAESLTFAFEFVETMASGNPDLFYTGLQAVSLLIDNVGFMIDITPGRPTLTFMNDPMTWAFESFPVMPVAERIGWWTWAIESGAWSIDENGGWVVNWDNYPPPPNTNVI